jgi:peptidoglycan/xylan/chitin deacetylase (PgdA/CDA1 family)/glycosyltransferase involved in cell wall biosynthesis
MRILFVSNVFPNPLQPTKGTFNRAMVQALARRHEVQVISPIAWTDELRAWKENAAISAREQACGGVPVHYPRYYFPPKVLRSWYGWFFWRSIRGVLDRVITAMHPDLIVGYWAHPDGEVAVRAARRAGVPSAVMVGGSDILLLTQHGNRRRRRIVKVLQEADAVVTVGEDLKRQVIALGIAAEKIHVVPRGVDTALFTPGDRDKARRRLSISVEERAILWVGRMVAVKGLDVLLDACVRLKQRGERFRLYLVGDGPVRRALEIDCRRRDLGEELRFIGQVAPEQLPDWYRAADITVLPSRSEGVPNVLRESLACGTPFVASRVGGIPDLAENAANRLVPPGDATALADAMAAVLSERRRVEGQSSQVISWDESADALTGILEQLAAVAPQGTASLAWRPRQLLRRAMAAMLPRRWFLIRGRVASSAVYLTFDDGPHPEHTPQLLDVLRRAGARATFFVIGQNAERYPALVKQIAADGHAIGHHSFFHESPERTSAVQLLGEVARTQELFAKIVGQPSQLFRPPYGRLTAAKLWRLWQAGQRVVLWNVDPKDYAATSAEGLRTWFRRRPLQAGDVVLLHDSHPHAVQVIPEVIDNCRARQLTLSAL